MFIQTEETPNPNTLKFIPGRQIIADHQKDYPASFTTIESCDASPLAKRLMSLDGVEGVFFGADFITITKQNDLDWYIMKPSILGAIMEHFVNNFPIFVEKIDESLANISNNSDNDDPIVKQIRELIDTRVRPAVAQDGGDILFDSFIDGVVYLKMQGSCSGCPSSTATLKSGIENMLKFYVPEVLEVQSVES